MELLDASITAGITSMIILTRITMSECGDRCSILLCVCVCVLINCREGNASCCPINIDGLLYRIVQRARERGLDKRPRRGHNTK